MNIFSFTLIERVNGGSRSTFRANDIRFRFKKKTNNCLCLLVTYKPCFQKRFYMHCLATAVGLQDRPKYEG